MTNLYICIMKRFLIIALAFAAFAMPVAGQNAKEIVDRMNQELDKGDELGTAVTFDIQIPIIGLASTRIKTLGKQSRAELDMKGEKGIIWIVNDTSWTYTPKDNKIEIALVKNGDNSTKETEMLNDITSGYDVSLVKETEDSWEILCKKSKSNTSKDDASKMELVVSKKNYLPISLKAKTKGITMTLRDFSLGVSKADVTFNPSAYKGVIIVDKR